ncbi:helix-turn-helix transcriptional regulator [Undibacterium sp. TJN19]|uniref:helix-turn-helix transcriptional regulator n=1 Tax=Undibacterium sp. TJN19 TaxID=3413055 RepID=UPI003BF38169
MSRSERLFKLLQVLRRHRRPVSGITLAGEVGVSIRTLYRDIATLQAQGAGIEGEPGIGYVMKPGFMLPPMMFGAEELDALVLGIRLVVQRGDATLAQGALLALSKINAVLPAELRHELEGSGLLVGAGEQTLQHEVTPALLRQAIRYERKLLITYLDPAGVQTQRTVWPFALVYFDKVRVLMTWCELRQGFRHFRSDRISQAEILDQRYPRHKQALLREWRKTEHVVGQSLLPETDSISG